VERLDAVRGDPADDSGDLEPGVAGLVVASFVLLVYGLVRLEAWPTVFGASLIVLAQLWRIDRLVVFYEGTR
jgi:hypothetical protein